MGYWFPGASTSTALTGSATFTSDAQPAAPYSSLVIAAKTDQDGTLYVDFSPDSTNWDSTLTFAVNASINEVHRLTITRPFFRVRYVNGPAAQSYFRLTVMGDNYKVDDRIFGGLVFTEKSDIIIRINTCSANNTPINGGYDLILIKN